MSFCDVLYEYTIRLGIKKHFDVVNVKHTHFAKLRLLFLFLYAFIFFSLF